MLPADKTVHIVKKENGEVHHNGNICRILQRGQRPQYNEYDAIAPGRMADPREGGSYGHRQSHAEISDHFTPIPESVRDDTI